ncbi:MAG: hypothetical protein KIT84_25530 [Labilithrix sp.]|nr:hypothetical protein [Labilithrix sp.]MCW5814414.1 hypothetical protein [Labilithrix sp.]
MKRPTLFVAAALLTVSSAARAGDRECAAAAESGQLLRKMGKLVEAQAQLRACASDCPKLVESDCRQWLAEIEQRLPTVVVGAEDHTGRAIADVALKVDGKPVATSLDGHPLSLNPGTHKLEVAQCGAPAVTQDVTVKEGAKAVAVNVRFPAPPPPQAQQTTATTTVTPAPSAPSLVAPIVLGAVGVAGVATFFAYHLSAKSDLDALRTDCAPRCGGDQVDTVDRKILVSHVALGAGVTALLGAAFVYFLPRLGSSRTTGDLRAWNTF